MILPVLPWHRCWWYSLHRTLSHAACSNLENVLVEQMPKSAALLQLKWRLIMF